MFETSKEFQGTTDYSKIEQINEFSIFLNQRINSLDWEPTIIRLWRLVMGGNSLPSFGDGPTLRTVDKELFQIRVLGNFFGVLAIQVASYVSSPVSLVLAKLAWIRLLFCVLMGVAVHVHLDFGEERARRTAEKFGRVLLDGQCWDLLRNELLVRIYLQTCKLATSVKWVNHTTQRTRLHYVTSVRFRHFYTARTLAH